LRVHELPLQPAQRRSYDSKDKPSGDEVAKKAKAAKFSSENSTTVKKGGKQGRKEQLSSYRR
jgi:hypothetical protein